MSISVDISGVGLPGASSSITGIHTTSIKADNKDSPSRLPCPALPCLHSQVTDSQKCLKTDGCLSEPPPTHAQSHTHAERSAWPSPANLLRLISPGLSHATQAMLFAQAPAAAARKSPIRDAAISMPFFQNGLARRRHWLQPSPAWGSAGPPVRLWPFASQKNIHPWLVTRGQISKDQGVRVELPSLQTEIDQVTVDGQLIRIRIVEVITSDRKAPSYDDFALSEVAAAAIALRPPSGSARSFLASSRLLGYLHLRDLEGPFEEMMDVVTLIVA
ncbi:hypothetical protein MRS44_003633 [Fusarium solani]|uniref:uncharacterized protein n=1 Tax=Fusarium solani TaxID=169388 RepID=UPI0032C41919|nr:hypothetical protein MRS44_003633 [Fusarium solani]